MPPAAPKGVPGWGWATVAAGAAAAAALGEEGRALAAAERVPPPSMPRGGRARRSPLSRFSRQQAEAGGRAGMGWRGREEARKKGRGVERRRLCGTAQKSLLFWLPNHNN